HSKEPVALVGFARASIAFARGRFPKMSLMRLVTKRPALDDGEVIALGALCGVDVRPPFYGRPAPFVDQLLGVIENYDLGDLYRADGRPIA
ncbi:hypothetical protein ABTN45_19355, partial [Acinetobacter baumannii]